ncbi:Spermidine/putrescine transport system permease protein PotB [Pseudooceanicola marinus]|uniref:Spermidine/putrescine transport system permease protein PotB n=1 Tax=Pseudooceanicola marinus TaxID=396013 RepID=A0A1X6YP59_9RHOB|nr:ABC transporter permease [Pseudooceanicola marinus]PJE29455.1 ABC transporter permease [Pseudooceanicola marinus]SLN26569.1 Spermidine/putrescine transport system permease protein PotB [Pseudooceanicola marinus]
MTLRRTLTIAALLTPGLGLILVMVGSVFYIAVAQSFGYYNLSGESAFSLDHWRDVLGSKQFGRSLGYSAYIAIISALGSIAIAYPLAIWMRKPFRGSLVVGSLLKAPLFVPGLVAAFLFLNVIAYHGVLNQFLIWTGLTDAPIRFQNDRNGFGVIFLQLWKNMPLALLLLTGAVQGISDEVVDAARDLGAGPLARFRKVIAPLTVQAMQAALIIIFIGAAGDFAFQVTAGPTNVQSMAQYMVFLKTSFGRWNQAAVVGVSLMGLALVGALGLAGLARLTLRGLKW